MITIGKDAVGKPSKSLVEALQDLEHILDNAENDKEEALLYVIDTLSRTIETISEGDASADRAAQDAISSQLRALTASVDTLQEKLKPHNPSVEINLGFNEMKQQLSAISSGLSAMLSDNNKQELLYLGREILKLGQLIKEKNKTAYSFKMVYWPEGPLKEVIATPKNDYRREISN